MNFEGLDALDNQELICKKVKMTSSLFVCPECGLEMPLPRFCGQQRKMGHKKDIWCPRCRVERTFKELKGKTVRNLAGELI